MNITNFECRYNNSNKTLSYAGLLRMQTKILCSYALTITLKCIEHCFNCCALAGQFNQN